MEPRVTFGVHYCIVCCCMREFVAWDESQRDASTAECFDCGYSYGKKRDEMVVDPNSKKFVVHESNVLSDAAVAKAQERRLREFRTEMLQSGVRLETIGRVTRSPSDPR